MFHLYFFKEVTYISFQELRTNSQIRISEVRVIDEKGNSFGILATGEAIKLAQERGMDLVEISPSAKPPVCKITDYSKYRYEQLKKDKENKKKQHVVVVKEIQIRPNIDRHDLEIKLSHAKEFLLKQFKVKFVIRFRGREMEYKDIRGPEMIDTVVKYLADVGQMENDPFKEDKIIIFVMMPTRKTTEAPKPAADQNTTKA
ncbi:MAG: translation initiation factor IF-3 [Spirochaetia bacterium]|nr:translation initiation factor IF-3 [Spirochaetia bacterium]